MFSYLRYFAAISLVLVLAGAISLSLYFRQLKEAELLESASKISYATVTNYSATVWAFYAADVLTYVPDQTHKIPPPQRILEYWAASKAFFNSPDNLKTTIFSPDVKRAFFGSTTATVIQENGERVRLFELDKAQKGQSVNQIIKNVTLAGGSRPNEKRVVLQCIIPVSRLGATSPDALVEFYVDVTKQWDELKFMEYMICATMVGTFTILIGVLIFTTRRAESIITKQHEINLELTAAASQAEAQSRDKSQFLASVSHELRTPLNAIIGFSEIIRNEAKDKLEKVYQDYIEDIYASGRHLLSLINDILDYSKAEAGKLQIEWAETDATKVIRNSLRMVLPRAEAGQVTLVEDIPSQHLVVVADAKKFKQVLLNLLSNAVKFTPAGGEVRCHAWNDVVTGALVLQVKDTGIGIAPKDISRVMTPFGQVDSALSRKYEGTGLGLPLAKKFVESMGGHFAIESELGRGTTVTFNIPKAPLNWGTPAMNGTKNTEDTDVASREHAAL